MRRSVLMTVESSFGNDTARNWRNVSPCGMEGG